MDACLPAALTTAIEAVLEGVARSDLAVRAARQSAGYRGGGTSAGVAGEADTLAYLLARMPATFAAVRAALTHVKAAVPDFTPASLLDAGAGPGTASWAVAATWPELASIVMLDRNAAFRAIAARLAKAGPAALATAQIVAGDVGGAVPKADLVVASYVLAELSQTRAVEVARQLWAVTADMLLLVEPGTPQGFARTRAARTALIAAGAQVAAPCTHNDACPIAGDDWCHFSQRLPRSRDHMRAKNATVPFEDERYAYVAVMRRPLVHRGARMIAAPQGGKPGVTLKLCDADGLRRHLVARRDRTGFARARRLDWGDLF